jgi:hypothetical protein
MTINDGVHLTDEGHKFVAQKVTEAIKIINDKNRKV